jgi:hypothetical protein
MMGMYEDEREALENYARELVAAGFKVWHNASTGRSPGYLTYEDPETGYRGLFQRSEFEGWQHHMPIIPSRENGSSMHLDTETDPWTVEAARETARETNRNAVVGTQRNAGPKAWLSRNARPIHDEG